MIDLGKQGSNGYDSSSDYIREMGLAVDTLCQMLMNDSKEFTPKDFFEKLHVYIENNDRLLYTNITDFIFSLEDDESFGVFQTNLDSVINYIYSESFEKDFPSKTNGKNKYNPNERTKRTVLKIWDHANLAERQYLSFKLTDEDYCRIAEEKMKEAELEMSKAMNMQLISLVAIFTALSFLVFGGLSSLDNIFLGAKDIPIVKLVIIGTIWCFCIMNSIFVFMFFVAKLTGLHIKSSENVNANIVQKYPLIWWCNLVLISILLLSCWSYYISCEGLSKKCFDFFNTYSTAYFLVGTLGIIILIIYAAYKIFKLAKIEPDKI